MSSLNLYAENSSPVSCSKENPDSCAEKGDELEKQGKPEAALVFYKKGCDFYHGYCCLKASPSEVTVKYAVSGDNTYKKSCDYGFIEGCNTYRSIIKSFTDSGALKRTDSDFANKASKQCKLDYNLSCSVYSSLGYMPRITVHSKFKELYQKVDVAVTMSNPEIQNLKKDLGGTSRKVSPDQKRLHTCGEIILRGLKFVTDKNANLYVNTPMEVINETIVLSFIDKEMTPPDSLTVGFDYMDGHFVKSKILNKLKNSSLTGDDKSIHVTHGACKYKINKYGSAIEIL